MTRLGRGAGFQPAGSGLRRSGRVFEARRGARTTSGAARSTCDLLEGKPLDDLEALIGGAEWFARCGAFAAEPGAAPLSAVASADTWAWLPTDRSQVDPIHGTALVEEIEAAGMGATRRAAELAAARWVSAGLRGIAEPVPALVDGPHNYTLAARYGAEFASRMAAREAVVGRPGFWWRVVRLFAAGYWPCGLIREGELLVVL